MSIACGRPPLRLSPDIAQGSYFQAPFVRRTTTSERSSTPR